MFGTDFDGQEYGFIEKIFPYLLVGIPIATVFVCIGMVIFIELTR